MRLLGIENDVFHQDVTAGTYFGPPAPLYSAYHEQSSKAKEEEGLQTLLIDGLVQDMSV